MREPIDWLYSLYRSHMAPLFIDTELTSTHYSFPEFLKIWGSQNQEQMIPQYHYVIGADGNILVDFIANFHQLQHDFDIFCDYVGLPKITLPFHNFSVEKQGLTGLNFDDYNNCRNIYSKDYILLDHYSGRILGPQEKNLSHCPFKFDYDTELSVLRGNNFVRNYRTITREDVIVAYKTILGRDPESERVIHDHLAHRITIAQLHEIFRASDEYRALHDTHCEEVPASHHDPQPPNRDFDHDVKSGEVQEALSAVG